MTYYFIIYLLQKRRSPYFQGVHDILGASLQFFTLPGGLDMDQAMNDGGWVGFVMSTGYYEQAVT